MDAVPDLVALAALCRTNGVDAVLAVVVDALLAELLQRRRAVLITYPDTFTQVVLNAQFSDPRWAPRLAQLRRSRKAPWLRTLRPAEAWGANPHVVLRPRVTLSPYGATLVIDDAGTRAVAGSASCWAAWDLGTQQVMAQGKNGVVVSPDGAFTLGTFREEQGELQRITADGAVSLGFLEQYFQCAVFQPGGSLLAIVSGDHINFWDRHTARLHHQVVMRHEHTATASFSPDGSWLVTTAYDATRVIDVATGALLLHRPGPLVAHTHSSCVWAPDGRRLIASPDPQQRANVLVLSPGQTPDIESRGASSLPEQGLPALQLPSGFRTPDVARWAPTTWALGACLGAAGRAWRVCALSGDGQTFVQVVDDGSLRVWRAPFPNLPARAIDHPGVITALGFFDDGLRLWCTGAGVVSLWDMATRARIAVIDGVVDGAYPTERTIAVRQNAGFVVVDADGVTTTRMTGSFQRVLVHGGHWYAIRSGGLVSASLLPLVALSRPVTAVVPVPGLHLADLVPTAVGVVVEAGSDVHGQPLEPPDWHPQWFLWAAAGELVPMPPPLRALEHTNGWLKLPDGERWILDESGDAHGRSGMPAAVHVDAVQGTTIAVAWDDRLSLYAVERP